VETVLKEVEEELGVEVRAARARTV